LISGISVHEGEITQIHHVDSKVGGVSLETGETVEVGTLLWIPPKQPLALIHALVENLGLEVDDDGFVKTNELQQTNIDRLWAAGDVQNARSSALDSAYTGYKVASMIVKEWYP
jgi:pyruvate/2-oxoglutarate dehydrogenase complex dihydrolipoamide dehydrogenase (E3) component